ncbi:MAG: asparagine synthase (glutamine-hydrolyzing) [Gammaproteobacteria bacterium]|nr:asparagine synthase (glutamine-hydrolyzing) [Gammaproteobacteria bacterium]
MCGISGIINWGNRFTKNMLSLHLLSMSDMMIHRGPDDAGLWIDDNAFCALAHRRLSIIDLTKEGRQPMSNEDESIWVTFNGEIYNYKRLREKLTSAGHVFKSHSDSEVLPHLFENMDGNIVKQLDGMFAFAAWQPETRRLILARDPFGKKPLYYSEGDGWFAFSSELKALKAIPDFDKTIDRDALSSYLLLQYVQAPKTIFSGAKKLPPGHFLEADFSKGKPTFRVTAYENYKAKESNISENFVQTSKKLEEIIVDAVEKRLVADVPLGAFLSGGVDSALVTAIASNILGKKLSTFTIGFEGVKVSEHHAAREIANYLGTDHHEKILKPDAVSLVREIAHRLDEPNGDSSCLPTLLLSQYASQHIKVAVSGDGGDEMFGGYGRYRDTLNEAANWQFRILRSLHLKKFWTPASAYLSSRWLIFQPEQVKYLMGEIPDFTKLLLENWESQLNDKSVPLIHRMRNIDVHSYLPGAVLAKVDRMSMQASLEVRCPLLDENISKLSQQLNTEHLWSPPNETKLILKKIASKYLPEQWMNRPKLGFGLPANAWSHNEVLDLANNIIISNDSQLMKYLAPDALKQFILRQSDKNYFSIYQLWPLLIMEEWLRNN